MSDYDTWKTTPPEPTVVGKCDDCDAELYVHTAYVHDRNEDEWFCDVDCFISKLSNAGDLVTEVINRDA